MRQHLGLRVVLLQLDQPALGKLFVDHAAPRPKPHFASRIPDEEAAQMLIGREQDGLLGRNLPDDFLRVAGGADDIAERLDLGAAVDIGDRHMIGVALAKRPELVRRTTIGQRTACLQVGEQHQPARVENLRRLGHEQHAAEDDHIRGSRRGFLRQLQAVADKIGHVLNCRFLIEVRQDDGIHLALEPHDFGGEIDVRHGPLSLGLWGSCH